MERSIGRVEQSRCQMGQSEQTRQAEKQPKKRTKRFDQKERAGQTGEHQVRERSRSWRGRSFWPTLEESELGWSWRTCCDFQLAITSLGHVGHACIILVRGVERRKHLGRWYEVFKVWTGDL